MSKRMIALACMLAGLGTAYAQQAAPPQAGAGAAQDGRAALGMPPGMKPLPPRQALTEGSIMSARSSAQRTQPDLSGSGPYIASYSQVGTPPYTVYAPVDLAAAVAKRKLPIYAFANGGCSPDGAAQRFHLTDIASFGYIAITPGAILSGPKAPKPADQPAGGGGRGPRQTVETVSGAIDWLIAENSRAGSPYFNKIDTSRIAIAGGSCGGFIAMEIALQPRIKSVTIHNSGINELPEEYKARMPPQLRASLPKIGKKDLLRMHAPIMYMIGGEEDGTYQPAIDDFGKLPKGLPAFFANRPHTGHLGMSWDPFAEGTKIQYHWLEYTLFGDKRAGLMFKGKDCSLCRDLVWEVHQRNL